MTKKRKDCYNSNAKSPAFAKRVSTLKKKAMELSVLCDVSVCVICYGPDGDLHYWPESPLDVVGLVSKYRGLRDEDRKKHSVDLGGFLPMEAIKAHNNTTTNMKTNAKKPILESTGEMDPDWDERIDGFSDEELRALVSQLDSKLVGLTAKLNGMMNSEAASQSDSTNAYVPVVDFDNVDRFGRSSQIQEYRIHHIEGADSAIVDILGCSSQTEEPRVHLTKGAQENDSNLEADDFFGELEGLLNDYELPVGGSVTDRGFLGFDATTTNDVNVIDSGFDFTRDNIWSGFGDVYNYGFMEIGDKFDAEMQQILEEPPLLMI